MSLYFTNLKYSFPFFNKVNSYSKHLHPDSSLWFQGERKCCGDFSLLYLKSDNLYKKSKDYLAKVRETGRKPLPQFLILVMLLMVLIEAWGFSYVFAGYAIPGASPKVQEYGGLGIAIFIALILTVLTHESGREWYLNNKLRELAILKGHTTFNKENREVTIDDTYSDDDYPEHAKLHNRIGIALETKHRFSISTGIFIFLIALGTIYVRQEALEEQIRVFQITSEIPLTLEDVNHMRSAGWATFAVLAVVFSFLQFIGALLGYKWGFAGKESEKAYLVTHKFHTAQDFEHYRELWNQNITEVGQKYLNEIQRKLDSRIRNLVAGPNRDQERALKAIPQKTFKIYMEEKNLFTAMPNVKSTHDKPKKTQGDFFETPNNNPIKSNGITAKIDVKETFPSNDKPKVSNNFFDSLEK